MKRFWPSLAGSLAVFLALPAAAVPDTISTPAAAVCPREQGAGLLYVRRQATCPRAPIKARETQKPLLSDRAAQSWEGPHRCVGDYCVFANPDFGSGGIVLVTTRDSAKRVKGLRSDTATGRDNDSSSSSNKNNNKKPFKAQVIDGKGLGLVAKRLIPTGELVMAEMPAILVHKEALEEPTDLYLPSLELAVSKMTAATRKAFLAQGTQSNFQGAMGIMDRLFTNSFQMALAGVGEDRAAGFHYGNFPNVSKLNHDCRPNLVFNIDNDLVHRIHAVRDIQAGEELSISYVEQTDPARERQARMHSSLGFVCRCAHCSLPAPEAAASERRIRRIKKLEDSLQRALESHGSSSSSSQAKKRVATAEELLGLYDVERLESKAAGAYRLAALAYRQAAEPELARKFAAKAAKWLEMERGKAAADVELMKRLAREI